jgi:hypothetical protein
MKTKGILILAFIALSVGSFAQDSVIINDALFKRMEDSIAKKLMLYRKEKGLKEQCYMDVYNPIIRHWGKDFLDRRNPKLRFTRNEGDTACTHFDFENRVMNTMNRVTRVASVAEIVIFSSCRDDFNERYISFFVEDFDHSKLHKEIMVSEDYSKFTIGYYYSEKVRSYVCYIFFFSEWVRGDVKKWVKE